MSPEYSAPGGSSVSPYRWGDATAKQISGGVITKDSGAHKITPEGGSGDDDLVTINGGTEGDLLILLAASAAGTITLKNGTGNILGPDGKDVPLDQSDERVILQYEGSYWRVQAVSPALFKVLYNPIEDDDISEADGFLRKTGAGAYEAIKCKLDATTAPTANDDTGDGYAVGALWIDVTNDKVYQCVDATAAAAVWKHLSARNRFQAVLVGPSSTVTTGTGLGGDWRISSQPITILAVGAYVEEPGTTGFLTIDINENGTTILSTRITIDSGEESSQDAATPAVISDAAGAADAVYTFDVDGVHTTPPEGLKVWIEYV